MVPYVWFWLSKKDFGIAMRYSNWDEDWIQYYWAHFFQTSLETKPATVWEDPNSEDLDALNVCVHGVVLPFPHYLDCEHLLHRQYPPIVPHGPCVRLWLCKRDFRSAMRPDWTEATVDWFWATLVHEAIAKNDMNTIFYDGAGDDESDALDVIMTCCFTG